jgi:homoserine dehydrogenase-like protein
LLFAVWECASFILLAGRGDDNRMISACRQRVRLSPRIPQPSSRKILRGSNQRISPDSALPLCRALHPIALVGVPRGLDRIAKIGQKALLPLLFVVSHSPALAGNSIERVYGILNGTGDYILTWMESEGLTFAQCLGEAQKLGYLAIFIGKPIPRPDRFLCIDRKD